MKYFTVILAAMQVLQGAINKRMREIPASFFLDMIYHIWYIIGMGYEIEFHRTENGRKPVEEFIQSLQEKQIAKILRDITLLQDKGSDLHYPYVDYIKGDKYNGLMELRTKQAGGIFRTFYFVVVKDRETKTEKAVLLHAIQKKTNKTPKRELDTALSRMKDYKSRG